MLEVGKSKGNKKKKPSLLDGFQTIQKNIALTSGGALLNRH